MTHISQDETVKVLVSGNEYKFDKLQVTNHPVRITPSSARQPYVPKDWAKSNWKVLMLALLLGGLPLSNVGIAQESKDAFRELLFESVDRLVFEKNLSIQYQRRFCLEVAEQFRQLGHFERASVLVAEIEELANKDNEIQGLFAVYDYYLRTGQIAKATDMVEKFPDRYRRRQKQRIVIARIQAGELDAFQESEFEITDFYTAVELGATLTEAGLIDTAIDFVSNLVFEDNDGNDPSEAAGLTYCAIANQYFRNGESEKARELVTRAKKVAGNRFYTGYAIEIDRRKIFGELTDDLEKFAQRGAAHRSHMGDELVANYAAALREVGKYAEARRVIEFIDKEENQQYALMNLAIWQARARRFDESKSTLDSLVDSDRRFQGMIHFAIAMKEAGKSKEAELVVDDLIGQVHQHKVTKPFVINRLAYLLAQHKDVENFQNIERRLTSAKDQSEWILMGLKGLTNAKFH